MFIAELLYNELSTARQCGPINRAESGYLCDHGGVAPIDISSHLLPGAIHLKIDLVDAGGFFASSTLSLNTNCTQNGVTGPATITGNPIPSTNPTPQQLTQNFSFNPTTDQKVKFVYDLSPGASSGNAVDHQ
jgi:hypothetical protein